MTRVKFEPRTPPPINIQSSVSSRNRYQRSPYPRCSRPEPPPESPVSINDTKEKIYHFPPSADFSGPISGWIKRRFPDAKFRVKWACSLVAVDENWELVKPSAAPVRDSASKFAHLSRMHAQFQGEDLGTNDVYFILDNIRKACWFCGMPQFVIEVDFFLKGRPVSTWYPPKPNKKNLQAFFEGNSSEGSALKVEEKEMQSIGELVTNYPIV
ncbi:hypothetical protein F4782DRAFT_512857 [Xylaria castorea]|nr:hypothetical protein F4782DRAFT_512857 [Xylaria castorea]